MELILRNSVLVIILIIITITDIKRREIDHEPLLAGLIFIIPFTLLGYNQVTFYESLIGGVVGFLFFLLLGFFGMGGGDIKLMGVVGLFFGWRQTIILMYGAFLIGSLAGVVYMAVKKEGMKSFIPFGPAISIAALITMFYGETMIQSTDVLWFLQ